MKKNSPRGGYRNHTPGSRIMYLPLLKTSAHILSLTSRGTLDHACPDMLVVGGFNRGDLNENEEVSGRLEGSKAIVANASLFTR